MERDNFWKTSKIRQRVEGGLDRKWSIARASPFGHGAENLWKVTTSRFKINSELKQIVFDPNIHLNTAWFKLVL